MLIILVRLARQRRLIGARDLIVDSAPIVAWRRADPDAAVGLAAHQAHRPDLIRSPTRVLAHLWERLLLQ